MFRRAQCACVLANPRHVFLHSFHNYNEKTNKGELFVCYDAIHDQTQHYYCMFAFIIPIHVQLFMYYVITPTLLCIYTLLLSLASLFFFAAYDQI